MEFVVLILLGTAVAIIWSWVSAWKDRDETSREQGAFAMWKKENGYGPARLTIYDPLYKIYVQEKRERQRRNHMSREDLGDDGKATSKSPDE